MTCHGRRNIPIPAPVSVNFGAASYKWTDIVLVVDDCARAIANVIPAMPPPLNRSNSQIRATLRINKSDIHDGNTNGRRVGVEVGGHLYEQIIGCVGQCEDESMF